MGRNQGLAPRPLRQLSRARTVRRQRPRLPPVACLYVLPLVRVRLRRDVRRALAVPTPSTSAKAYSSVTSGCPSSCTSNACAASNPPRLYALTAADFRALWGLMCCFTLPLRSKTSAACLISLYTACRVRCLVQSSRCSHTYNRPACANIRARNSAGKYIRCVFPVLESLTYGRAVLRTVSVLSDNTSSILNPVYKLVSIASALTGIIAASTSRKTSSSTQPLRIFSPPLNSPDFVNSHCNTTFGCCQQPLAVGMGR